MSLETCHWWLLAPLRIRSKSHSLQLSLTLCDHMDSSPPGSSVHGIFQAGILEGVAIAFSKGSSQGLMISKSSQNLMCTFYWHEGTLILLIRSKDFFTTLLCLSVIFFQCPRPAPDLTSRETDLQRLTYSGFLTAWLPGARNYPPLFLSCIPRGRTKHLPHKWKSPQKPVLG